MKRNIEHLVMQMLIESGLTVLDSRELCNKWNVPLLKVNVINHPTAGPKLVVTLEDKDD